MVKTFMRSAYILSPLALAAILSACATAEPVVSPQTAPLAHLGYVGGNFTITAHTFGIALILTDQETKKQFLIPFSEQKRIFKPTEPVTNLVALPPGSYKMTHWTSYNGADTSSREFTQQIEEAHFQVPFKVEPGKILFLGQFEGQSIWKTHGLMSRTSANMVAKELSRTDAEALVRNAYPAFNTATLACLLCTP